MAFPAEFHRQTCVISDLYLRSIRRTFEDDWGKVIFLFSDVPVAESRPVEERWVFPFEQYILTPSNDGKKKLVLDHLHAAFKQLASKRGWDIAPLNNAYEKCLEANLIFDGYWKKVWVSPDRVYRVKVYYRNEFDWFEVFAEISPVRGGGAVRRVPLARQFSDNALEHGLVKSALWRSNHKLVITSGVFGWWEKWPVDCRS